MPEEHDPLLHALGACGPDVILAQHLQQARPGHARDQRDIDRRERQAWQDRAGEELAEVLRRRRISLHRQPAQVDGEELDQHVADDEDRHGKAQHREAHHRIVDPCAVPPGRDHAHRHGDHDRQEDRQDGDVDRRPDPLPYHLRHRRVGNERDPQIAVQKLVHPCRELHVDGFVEPERRADAFELRRRRGIAGENRRRIARCQSQEKKDEHGDDQHDRNDRQDSSEDIANHRPRDPWQRS